MVKRIDLVKQSVLFKNKKRVADIALFICELFKTLDIKAFYLSAELTLIIYNFIINTFTRISPFETEQYVIAVIQLIFKDAELTESQLEKIHNDIEYIKHHKLFTKISAPYFKLCQTYYFFFVPE